MGARADFVIANMNLIGFQNFPQVRKAVEAWPQQLNTELRKVIFLFRNRERIF